MAIFADAKRWESDPEYREACDAEIRSTLQARAGSAEEMYGELKGALDARGLTTEILHTGGGTYNLAIALDPVVEGQDWEGWRMLIGGAEADNAGIVTWEASVDDDEGTLDAITLTLKQFSGEPVDGLADQLATLALRLTGEGTLPLG